MDAREESRRELLRMLMANCAPVPGRSGSSLVSKVSIQEEGLNSMKKRPDKKTNAGNHRHLSVSVPQRGGGLLSLDQL